MDHSRPYAASHQAKLGRAIIRDTSSSDDDDSNVPSSRPTSGERRATTASNLNLAAGRRKLEEFKRKKALALAKKTQTSMSEEKKYEYAEAKLEEAREEIHKLKSELRVATSISVDDRLADARAAMEREKAALLGEVVTLRSTVSNLEEELAKERSANVSDPSADAAGVEPSDASSHAAAIELLRGEIDTMTVRAEGLERSLFETQKVCDALTEEKESLEEQVRELTVKLAVPSGPVGAPALERAMPALDAPAEPEYISGPDAGIDSAKMLEYEAELVSLRAELEGVRASLGAAVERSQELEDQVEESRENIDSLRELLGEGETERVELVSSMEAIKLQHSQVEDQLKGELEAARLEVAQWKDRAEKAEISVSAQQTSFDIGMGAHASPSEAALRMRLAKAEGAVEAERQAYYNLEQKSKHWQEALEENASLKQCVAEMRENEKAMQRYIESIQHGAAAQRSSIDQQHEARIQEMQAELNESSQTIMRLSGEVNDLVARLKAKEMEETQALTAQNDVAHGFDHVAIDGPVNQDFPGPAPPVFPSQSSPLHDAPPMPEERPQPPPATFAPPPPAAQAFPPPPSFSPQEPTTEEEASSLFDLIDQGAQVEANAPVVPPPMEFPMPPPAPVLHPETHAPPETRPPPHLEPQVQPPMQPATQPPMQPQTWPPTEPVPQATPQENTNLMPWTIPGQHPESPTTMTSENPVPPPEKKSVGFWGWIAGADRVVENE